MNESDRSRLPKLIRCDTFKSDNRTRIRSQEQNQANETVQKFRIADLKQYERMQRPSIMDRTKTSPMNFRNNSGSPDLEITQTRLNARKQNQFSVFDLLPIHIKVQIYKSESFKDFYSGRTEITKILHEYSKLNEDIECMVQVVKCYRFELGSSLEQISSVVFNLLRRLMEVNIKMHDEVKNKYERELSEGLKTIKKLEDELKKMDEKQRSFKNLLGYHESEYKICKLNSDALQNEVVMLHELIKQDLQKMMMRIGQLEESRKSPEQQTMEPKSEDPTDRLAHNLHNLQKIIVKLDQEHNEGQSVISEMSNVIKAMLKGNKQNKFTQVNDGELAISLRNMQTEVINLIEPFPTGPESFKLQQNNWSLSKNLIIFLAQTIDGNELGRVIPWETFKYMIYQIYSDRVNDTEFIEICLGENVNYSDQFVFKQFVGFDQYLCIFMLKQYKERKVAEIKLLDFLVSLRYHQKSKVRALMCAKLCGIVPLAHFQGAENTMIENQVCYKLDPYLINFFLFCYQTIQNIPIENFYELEDGTFITQSKAMELINTFIPFVSESQKGKVRKRIEKSATENGTELIVEIDQYYGWLMSEYIETKKNTIRILVKQFTKKLEADRNGITDLTEFKQAIDTERPISYPHLNEYIKVKAFFNALTMEGNTPEVSATQFLNACSLNGIDSPFIVQRLKQSQAEDSSILNELTVTPSSFLQLEATSASQNQTAVDRTKSISGMGMLRGPGQQSISGLGMIRAANQQSISGMNQLNAVQIKRTSNASIVKKPGNLKGSPNKDQSIPKPETAQRQQFNSQLNFQQELSKLNSAQTQLIVQHLAILKELRKKCQTFIETCDRTQSTKKLYQEFEKVAIVVQAACDFLNFPLREAEVKQEEDTKQK